MGYANHVVSSRDVSPELCEGDRIRQKANLERFEEKGKLILKIKMM